MFKRVGVLTMILAGGLAVLQPAVAQARDWDDHGRYERRDYDDRNYDRRARDWREREWREHEWRERQREEWRERQRRYEYRNEHNWRPYYYDRYGNYCPR